MKIILFICGIHETSLNAMNSFKNKGKTLFHSIMIAEEIFWFIATPNNSYEL